jgi:hypothetical protein
MRTRRSLQLLIAVPAIFLAALFLAPIFLEDAAAASLHPGAGKNRLILSQATPRPPRARDAGAPADGGATLSFRKIFKSSTPEYTEIHIRESGSCTYDLRSLDDPPDPRSFDVGPALREKMFALAAQLQNFRGADLDMKRRIANLGQKTFRYERGSEVHEVQFNYTINAPANQLLQIFEGLARQQELLSTLSRRMKYDRLGVNDALMQLDTELQRRLLPEPESLLPLLEQICNDTRFVDIARQRARALIESIRHPR